jgi:heptaprenyl diphosphate synthase
VRLGLANLVTVIAVLTLGWRDALLVTVIRVVLGALLLGGFLGPAFLLSLGGGLAGVFAMSLMARGAWRLWSPIGVSVAGAFAHAGAQLLLLAAVLVRAREALWIAPGVLLPALLAGIATGLLANLVLLRWQGYLRTVV